MAAGKFRVYSPNENKKEENDDDDDDNLFDNDKKNRNIRNRLERGKGANQNKDFSFR